MENAIVASRLPTNRGIPTQSAVPETAVASIPDEDTTTDAEMALKVLIPSHLPPSPIINILIG